MSAADDSVARTLLKEANELALNDEFEAAIETFTQAVEKCDSSNTELLYDIYNGRALVYFKLKKASESLKDAESALALKKDNQVAYLRKGMALHLSKKYQEAHDVLQEGIKVASTDSAVNKLLNEWVKKCEKELPAKVVAPPAAEASAVSAPAAPPQPPAIKHEWYQTESYVTVSVLAKNVSPSDITITPTPTTLKIVSNDQEKYKIDLNFNLFGEILPEAVQTKFLSTKIEIKLKKTEAGSWSKLETDKTQAPAFRAVPANPEAGVKPYYPSSSKKQTNWDRVAADIAAEEKDEKLEGDAALNKLFKDIYANGSDETRKAMNKSFVESGGTVLSTNWGDVGAKKLDVKAPDGLEWKKWD